MSFLPFLLTSDTLYSAFISCLKSNHGVLWSAFQCTRWSGLGRGAERGGSKCLYVLLGDMGCRGALLRLWGGGLRLKLSSVVVAHSWLSHETEVRAIACIVWQL